jgi:hypothetical protein
VTVWGRVASWSLYDSNNCDASAPRSSNSLAMSYASSAQRQPSLRISGSSKSEGFMRAYPINANGSNFVGDSGATPTAIAKATAPSILPDDLFLLSLRFAPSFLAGFLPPRGARLSRVWARARVLCL